MPRKSNISAVSAATGDEGSGTPMGKEREGVNVEDLSMPRTMVQRLAKGVLPPNTIIQKDAITAMSKGATVFINYLSHFANELTAASNRKTISPADVFMAIRDTEFGFMIPRLEAELTKYNEVQTGKRNYYRQKVREGTMGNGRRKGAGGDSAAAGVGVENAAAAAGGGTDDGERVAKKARLEENGSIPVVEGNGRNGVVPAAGGEADGDETVEEGADEEEEEEEEEEDNEEPGVGEEVGDDIDEEGEEGADEDGEEDVDNGETNVEATGDSTEDDESD